MTGTQTVLAVSVFIVFAALQIADVVTTSRVLRNGGWETNPIVRMLMRCCGAWWWLPKLVLAMACGAYMAFVSWPEGPALLVFLCLVYCWVVWSNVQQERRGRVHMLRVEELRAERRRGLELS